MKKALFVLILLFSLVNLADLTTFILLGENGALGDSNPLIVLFGSPWWLYGIKILIMVGLWWLFSKYNDMKATEFNKYCLILIVVLGLMALAFGVYSNVVALQNPEIMKQAISTPRDVKITYYFNFMKYIVGLPLVAGLIAFKIWEWAKTERRTNG